MITVTSPIIPTTTQEHPTTALLGRVMDALREKFVIVDRQRTIVAINAAAMPNKLTREQVLGKKMFDIFPNLQEQGFEGHIERAFRERESYTEQYVPHRTVDGFFGYHHRKFFPVLDGDDVSHVIIITENVHEERMAQLKARAAEGEYRQLIETLHLVSFELDAAGRFVHVSNAVTPLFGYAPQQLVEQSMTHFLHRDDVGATWHMYWQIVNQGRPYGVCENRFRTVNDAYVHMRWSVHPLYDARGAVVGCRGVGEDISEDARKVRALEEAHNLFRNVFQVSPQALIIVRADAVYAMNRLAHRIALAKRDELNGMPFSQLFVHADRDIVRSVMASTDVNGRCVCDARLLRRTGEVMHTHLTCVRMRPEYAIVALELLLTPAV